MKDELITKLTKLWYSCLIDHHKDRDCHWQIEKTWSYGKDPSYSVIHSGYIFEDFISPEFKTSKEAHECLISKLIEAIKSEAQHWLRTSKEKEDWNYEIAIKHVAHFEEVLSKLNIIKEQL